jgi:hypothetical protein
MKKTKVVKTPGKRGGPQPGSGRPRLSKGGTIVFAGSVTVEMAAQVAAKCKRDGVSRSQALRDALTLWLN